MPVDLKITNLGSVTLLEPLTTRARRWISEFLVFESWQRVGANLAIESRMAPDIAQGAADHGLQLSA